MRTPWPRFVRLHGVWQSQVMRVTLVMAITRKHLIDLCDQFLRNDIGKREIEDFAWQAITSDEMDWDEDIVSDILFEWDNEEINFQIDHHNMELWKKRLETDVDELYEHNCWNAHIEKQQKICLAFQSKWNPINKKLIVGVSDNLSTDPVNGLRHPSEKGTTGWFIWTGEYSESEDFFKPICAEHLLKKRPDIIKFLGLDIGFRFLCDKSGYQDVWYDDSLTRT